MNGNLPASARNMTTPALQQSTWSHRQRATHSKRDTHVTTHNAGTQTQTKARTRTHRQ